MASRDNGFKHPEADIVLLSASAKLRNEHTEAVVQDSEDTDVYVQAAYVSHQIRADLLLGRKREKINCRAVLSEDDASVIIPLRVMSGSDHTSGFHGHGIKQLLQ